LLFTEARLVRRAVQWRPMKPESWSSWFPLKSSPTGSCRCVGCCLQNVPRDLLEMKVLTGPRHLADCTAGMCVSPSCVLPSFVYVSPSLVLGWNPSCASQRTAKETARNDSCVVKIVGYRGNRVVTSIPLLITCRRFSWEAPTRAITIYSKEYFPTNF
jgi:hypothetical protein